MSDTQHGSNRQSAGKPIKPRFRNPDPNVQTPAAIRLLSSRTMKVGRNKPCPCGSGKKYKRCCGRTEAE